MRRPAVVVNQNAGFGLPETPSAGPIRGVGGSRHRAGSQHVGPRKSGKSEAADPQHLTTADTVAQANTATKKRNHADVQELRSTQIRISNITCFFGLVASVM